MTSFSVEGHFRCDDDGLVGAVGACVRTFGRSTRSHAVRQLQRRRTRLQPLRRCCLSHDDTHPGDARTYRNLDAPFRYRYDNLKASVESACDSVWNTPRKFHGNPRNSMDFHGNFTEYSARNPTESSLKISHVFPWNSMGYKTWAVILVCPLS